MELYERLVEEVYGEKVECLSEAKCRIIQEAIKDLRKSYQSNTPKTSYEREVLRKAYMLAYYPNYMEVAKIMTELILKDRGVNNQKRLSLAYFAAGPGPEILGSVTRLMEHKVADHIQTFCLDIEEEWEDERIITQHLIEEKSGVKGYHIQNVAPCDLSWDCEEACMGWERCKVTLFKEVDIYFMNNCINHLGHSEETITLLQKKIECIKPGAYFVITDLKYGSVCTVLDELSKRLKQSGEIISQHIHGEPQVHVYSKGMPNVLEEKIFTGKDGLIKKKNTYYYYLIYKRD